MTAKQLLQFPIGRGSIDALLVRLGQITCFVIAGLVFILGLLKVSGLNLAYAQFFSATHQVVQTAFAVLYPRTASRAESESVNKLRWVPPRLCER